MSARRVVPCLLGVAVAGCATTAADWRTVLPAGADSPWEAVVFGGDGPLRQLPDGSLELGAGAPLTGVRWPGAGWLADAPGFELEVEVTKVQGSDFFCGLTFPVPGAREPGCCTLILGGWGGALVGLSCIDGRDAADNATATAIGFEDGRTYRVRLIADGRSIRAELDGETVVQHPVAAHRFTLRAEVTATAPLGLCTYTTTALVHRIRVRPLP